MYKTPFEFILVVCRAWQRECEDVSTQREKNVLKFQKKMVPTNFSKAHGECENGTHQCLHPQRVSQQFPAPQADALRLANESLSHKVWVLFKQLLLRLALKQVSLWMSSLRDVFSAHYSPVHLTDMGSIRFHSQMFLGLVFQVQVLKVGVPDVGYKPFPPHWEWCSRFLSSLLIVGNHARGKFYGNILS